MRRFNTWIKEVKEDLDTPDLWAELQRDAQLLGGVSARASENTAFTPEEGKSIFPEFRKPAANGGPVTHICSSTT